MIFVDSNIPMYLVGAPHANKDRAQELLRRAVGDRERLVTDAEVLQEILHRYVAIRRLEAIQPAFDALLGLVDEVFPIDVQVLQEARALVLGRTQVSARDAVHAAVMSKHALKRILTFDAGFDAVPGVVRLS